MHEILFADAARPAPVVCLKLRLLPYSLGHELLLLKQRSPFLILSFAQFNALPITDQHAALIRAVMVCCNSWEENKKPHRWLRLWHWGIRNTNWPLAIADFRNYLAEAHAEMPGPDPEADDICAGVYGYSPMKDLRGRQYGSPILARLFNFIAASDCAEPWDFSFSLANALYAARLESEGSLRVENFQELDEKTKLAEIRAEIAKEEAEAKAAQEAQCQP